MIRTVNFHYHGICLKAYEVYIFVVLFDESLQRTIVSYFQPRITHHGHPSNLPHIRLLTRTSTELVMVIGTNKRIQSTSTKLLAVETVHKLQGLQKH